MTEYGIIASIQKYTIHDGPGIRTEVFFKGCPLRCLWCSNPEGLEAKPELGFYPDKCLGEAECGWCRRACPAPPPPGVHVSAGFDTDACRDCLKCAEACPAGAIRVWGQRYTVPELMTEIRKDRSFYDKSGGGVTLSGGEVLLQWEFAAALLRACREEGIHTCVESALHVPWAHAAAVFQYADMIITDIKHMDSKVHKALTGAGNERILENIRRLAALGKPLVVRTPVVPGYNGDEESIRSIASFLRDELGGALLQYQLLPYRKMGTEKYASLRRPYPLADYRVPERSEWEPALRRYASVLREEYGLPAVAGSGAKLE
ncbi:MAG: glycyl-radical enzyme activating protein [Ruminococcaceae bacterium]|nr:glycyl-radical enzyme activating protein [Oscillospiraceae bacterium]